VTKRSPRLVGHNHKLMLRDSGYFVSAILSLAVILGWLGYLTLAMQGIESF
jgi:hypothetical protein